MPPTLETDPAEMDEPFFTVLDGVTNETLGYVNATKQTPESDEQLSATNRGKANVNAPRHGAGGEVQHMQSPDASLTTVIDGDDFIYRVVKPGVVRYIGADNGE
jgi:hypothetical protein